MDKELIEQRLREHFAEAAEIYIEGEGNKFGVRIVAEQFAGLSPVRRQQMVYKIFSAELASGELHALSLRLLTPEEAARQS